MAFTKEYKIFDDFVKSKGLKHSEQRREILHLFLKTEEHLTAEKLHKLINKKNPAIGIATIYRTLKLLCQCGLGRELRLGDGTVRYEHDYGHEHHDHFICLECDRVVEAFDPEIEKLQERLARKVGFKLQGHKLLLYGTCKECNK